MPAAAPRRRLPWDLIRAPFEDLATRYPDVLNKPIVVDREKVADENEWTFVMLSPAQNEAVVAWLLDHSSRPQKAVRLWAALFRHLRRDTGEIMLTREQMAEGIGENLPNVSRIMTELEGIGAITRQRLKVAGMRGPGVVRYFMNPNIATHLPKTRRGKAQAKAPKLTLVAIK
jgi:hypothetical protein